MENGSTSKRTADNGATSEKKKKIYGHVDGSIVQNGLRQGAIHIARHITMKSNAVSAITMRNKERQTSQA